MLILAGDVRAQVAFAPIETIFREPLFGALYVRAMRKKLFGDSLDHPHSSESALTIINSF